MLFYTLHFKLYISGMTKQFEKIIKQYEDLSQKLSFTTDSQELKRLGKKQAGLSMAYEQIMDLKKLEKQAEENQKYLKDKDPDVRQLAEEEDTSLKTKIGDLKLKIEEALLPKDPLNEKDAIVEIRAAAGGDESSLFAGELFRMYSKYAETNKWKTSLNSQSRNEIGGFKEVIFSIKGKNVYGDMKFESGVHRVQRVPETEKTGRVHTSTVTVAVLPKIEEADFKIEPKDLKIETSTSQGAGGQSVNTTYSAIKITHLPSGITAQSQDERSQIQNRAKAMEVIVARVFNYYEEKKQKELKEQRLSQIGTGDRSEKIRTYNFPQDRITDHRINQNWNQTNEILNGKLWPIIDALKAKEKKQLKNI